MLSQGTRPKIEVAREDGGRGIAGASPRPTNRSSTVLSLSAIAILLNGLQSDSDLLTAGTPMQNVSSGESRHRAYFGSVLLSFESFGSLGAGPIDAEPPA